MSEEEEQVKADVAYLMYEYKISEREALGIIRQMLHDVEAKQVEEQAAAKAKAKAEAGAKNDNDSSNVVANASFANIQEADNATLILPGVPNCTTIYEKCRGDIVTDVSFEQFDSDIASLKAYFARDDEGKGR